MQSLVAVAGPRVARSSRLTRCRFVDEAHRHAHKAFLRTTLIQARWGVPKSTLPVGVSAYCHGSAFLLPQLRLS